MNTKKIINQLTTHRSLRIGGSYVPIHSNDTDKRLLVDVVDVLEALEELEIEATQLPEYLKKVDFHSTIGCDEGYITNHLIIEVFEDPTEFEESFLSVRVQLTGDASEDVKTESCTKITEYNRKYTRKLYYKDSFAELFLKRIIDVCRETEITINGKEFVIVTNPFDAECEIYEKENMDIKKGNWIATSFARKIKYIKADVREQLGIED